MLVLFQSLSGFQVRCNLAPVHHNTILPVVSIPIGFSSSLQRADPRAAAVALNGFNPYRVFKFVATSDASRWPPLSGSVSIPIGFSSSLQLTISLVYCNL